MNSLVPILLGRTGQFAPESFAVPAAKSLVAAISEQAEKLVEIQPPDTRYFEFQKGILTKVHVHRIDTARFVQSVIKRITSRGGDEHEVILRREVHHLPVQSRILPASVVNKVVPVNVRKNAVRGPIKQGFHWSRNFHLICFTSPAVRGLNGTFLVFVKYHNGNEFRLEISTHPTLVCHTTGFHLKHCKLMYSLVRFAKTAWAHIQTFGFQHSTATLFRELRFDFQNGVNTTRPQQAPDIYSIPYQGADPRTVQELFRRLPSGAVQTTFIDFGCGKGRVLILAAQFGFERIIGVELDPKLAQDCQANLEKARNRTANGTIQILTQDATSFILPMDPLTVFLYNPFVGAPLNVLVSRLHTRALDSAASVRVVYVNPVGLDLFLNAGFTVTYSLEHRRVRLGVLLEFFGGQSGRLEIRSKGSFGQDNNCNSTN